MHGVPTGPVPEDMLAVRTINTAGATNTETAKAAGLRTGIGYARTETMDRRPHQALQGMDAMAETALMADAAAVHITDRKTVLHLAVPDIWSGYAAGVRCRRP